MVYKALLPSKHAGDIVPRECIQSAPKIPLAKGSLGFIIAKTKGDTISMSGNMQKVADWTFPSAYPQRTSYSTHEPAKRTENIVLSVCKKRNSAGPIALYSYNSIDFYMRYAKKTEFTTHIAFPKKKVLAAEMVSIATYFLTEGEINVVEHAKKRQHQIRLRESAEACAFSSNETHVAVLGKCVPGLPERKPRTLELIDFHAAKSLRYGLDIGQKERAGRISKADHPLHYFVSEGRTLYYVDTRDSSAFTVMVSEGAILDIGMPNRTILASLTPSTVGMHDLRCLNSSLDVIRHNLAKPHLALGTDVTVYNQAGLFFYVKTYKYMQNMYRCYDLPDGLLRFDIHGQTSGFLFPRQLEMFSGAGRSGIYDTEGAAGACRNREIEQYAKLHKDIRASQLKDLMLQKEISSLQPLRHLEASDPASWIGSVAKTYEGAAPPPIFRKLRNMAAQEHEKLGVEPSSQKLPAESSQKSDIQLSQTLQQRRKQGKKSGF